RRVLFRSEDLSGGLACAIRSFVQPEKATQTDERGVGVADQGFVVEFEYRQAQLRAPMLHERGMAPRICRDIVEIVTPCHLGVGKMLTPQRERGVSRIAPAMDDARLRQHGGNQTEMTEIERVLVDMQARRRVVLAQL